MPVSQRKRARKHRLALWLRHDVEEAGRVSGSVPLPVQSPLVCAIWSGAALDAGGLRCHARAGPSSFPLVCHASTSARESFAATKHSSASGQWHCC